MRVQDHMKLSTVAAVIALPWLKKDTWIPFASSILIDVDHYLWYAVAYRTISLRAALRYYGQAAPPQLPEARVFHHPLVLGFLLFIALRLHSRVLALILAGLLFHVSLDAIHVTQLSNLKQSLSEQAGFICQECNQQYEALQLHTAHIAFNPLARYNPEHLVVLCAECHKKAHAMA